MTNIFNTDFLELSSDYIVDAIKKDGCFYFENAVREDICDRQSIILQEQKYQSQ